ncbi:MAG: LysM peptidoglycan-binding domain-containing protein [Patescibacteria group bacterium]|jgi:hypothetical protein
MTKLPHQARRYGYRIKKRFREDPFSVIVLYALFFSLFFLIFAFRGLIATVFIKPLGIINPSTQTTTLPTNQTPADETNSFILKSDQKYTVKEGDTLYSVANALELNWKDLATLNEIQPPYDLEVGQELKLP